MNGPRIYLKSKGTQERDRVDPVQATAVQHWSSGEPPRKKRPEDSWSPYFDRRFDRQKTIGKLKKKNKRRPFSATKRRTSRREKSEGAVFKLVVTSGSAVLVGLLMGFFILKLFVVAPPPHTNAIDAHLKEGKREQPEAVTEKVPHEVVLPAVAVVWVQGGVYESEERAEKLANEKRQRGRAAVVRPVDNQFRVFYGVGMNREEALTLASLLRDEGTEVYLKDDLPIRETSISGAPGDLNALIEAGEQIIGAVAPLSVQGLGGDDVSQTVKGKLKRVEEAYRRFQNAFNALEKALDGRQRQAVHDLKESLSEVVNGAEAYAGEPSPSSLWKIQEGIMRYFIAYDQLNRH